MGRIRSKVFAPGMLVAMGVGAGAAYLLDPTMGRTRRSELADRVRALLRRSVRKAEDRTERTIKRAEDRAHGIAHEVARDEADLVPENDQTLIDKVRSEVVGGERWRPYTINVDAADGEVALRGQLDRPDQIRDLVDEVSRVPGVRKVENFLHLPGTPPPNVAEARRAGNRST